MKKTARTLILTTLILIGLALLSPSNVQAATKVKANKWYSGTISGGNVKQFKFKCKKSGFLTVTGSCTDCYDSREVKEASTHVYAAAEAVEEAAEEVAVAAGEEEVYVPTPEPIEQSYFISKGSTYILKINGEQGKQGSYRFKINLKSAKTVESESNNSKKRATVLKFKKLAMGELYQGDKDWYVFKAPKSGKFTVSAKVLGEKSAERNIKYTSYKGSKKSASGRIYGNTVLYKGKLKKGQKIYIKISPNMYSGIVYQLKVSK